MRCEGTCVLDVDGDDAPPLVDYLAQLRRCRECPYKDTPDPRLRRVLGRLHEVARADRRQRSTIRKLEHERQEFTEDLERYDERIAKLERLQRRSSEEIEAELSSQLERVREQERELEALSVPIIHVWEGVFVLPVIGALTAARARVLTERLLQEVTTVQAHTAIIDITGVAELDAETSVFLARMISALDLLGARALLTGVSPAVARTLVELDIDMSGITTLRNVRDALRRAGLVESGA